MLFSKIKVKVSHIDCLSSPIVYLPSYNDARNDFVMNEVALDYNSGFQMAVAGLLNDVAGKVLEMIRS